jgi:hypothetical protein
MNGKIYFYFNFNFKNSTEWQGLQQSAKVLDVQLTWINKNFKRNFNSMHSLSPKWEIFDKNFFIPIILKYMDILAIKD